MKIEDKIIIATDFSDTPGARYISDGDYSAEEFLSKILLPKFEKAVENKYLLLVDLDGVWGYPSSFVSGSFGALSIDKGAETVLKHVCFKSNDNEITKEKFITEIKNPTRKK